MFAGASDEVPYIGEFWVDQTKPFYITDAPDVTGAIRAVFVFRLRPVGEHKGDLLPVAEEPLEEKRASVNED